MKKIALVFILSCSLGSVLAAAPPTIALLSPQGGENWVIGKDHAIVWSTMKGVSGTLYINLWGYNAANQLIHLGPIAEVNYKLGSYVWKAGAYAGKTAGVGRYHIRIRIWYTPQQHMDAWDSIPFRLVVLTLPGTIHRQ